MPSEGYRLGFRGCLDLLSSRLAESAPSRIQLLAGPRQVGKTTLLLNRDYHPLVLCDQPEAVAVERLGIEAMRRLISRSPKISDFCSALAFLRCVSAVPRS